MEIVTKGLFKLSSSKNYVLIDDKRNEQGALEVNDEIITAIMENGDEHDFTEASELEAFLADNNYTITSESIRWVEYNPNPQKNKANDCSIRAYCAAENLPWDEAYDIACKRGKDNAQMPNDNKNCEDIILNEFGYTKHKLSKEQKGMTVKEFAVNHSSGTYICSVPGHLVTVIDGRYYDSWDSGEKKIKCYYTK